MAEMAVILRNLATWNEAEKTLPVAWLEDKLLLLDSL